MCGRYTLTNIQEALRVVAPFVKHIPDNIPARYNIAPTQPVAVVPNYENPKLDFFLWGLIPSWSKDAKIASRLINARGETVAEKPSFRAAFKRRRCLILADGFYEWIKMPGETRKTPHYIQMESKDPFAFAGLWEIWHSPEGDEIRTCTIITTTPNEMVAKLHNRMPVILDKDEYALWLDPEEKTANELGHLINPFPAVEMMHYPVSTLVNSPANDVPETIVPA